MNGYLALKTIHMSCALLSISLFTLRGWWMLRESARLRQRWVRIVPHAIDTVLLTSAVLLALNIGQYPGVHSWLSAKLAALLLYIVLGSVAIKRGRTRKIRMVAGLAAMVTFAYIVSVAITRQPWPLA